MAAWCSSSRLRASKTSERLVGPGPGLSSTSPESSSISSDSKSKAKASSGAKYGRSGPDDTAEDCSGIHGAEESGKCSVGDGQGSRPRRVPAESQYDSTWKANTGVNIVQESVSCPAELTLCRRLNTVASGHVIDDVVDGGGFQAKASSGAKYGRSGPDDTADDCSGIHGAEESGKCSVGDGQGSRPRRVPAESQYDSTWKANTGVNIVQESVSCPLVFPPGGNRGHCACEAQ
ncbi:hypothetical protein V5799_007757 [Amblyomma americanum]|uniref:Uncharacterized protein n=1 Tax=Amblyomma americanum TaxID=6943 RepID=A0AAQ4FH15_AMBAM